MVSNGSIPPQDWNRTVWNLVGDHRNSRKGEDATAWHERQQPKLELSSKRHPLIPNPLKAWRIIVEKDVALIVLLTSLIVTGFHMIMVPIPSVFEDTYKPNQIQVCLCYM